MNHPAAHRMVVVSLLLALLVLGIGRTPGPASGMPDPGQAADHLSPTAFLDSLAQGDPLSKVEGRLQDIAREAPAKRETAIVVMSTGPVELDSYSDFVHQFTWPAGEHVSILSVAASDVMDIAALPGVYDVSWADPEAAVEPPPIQGTAGRSLPPLEPDELRARLDAASPWSETAARLGAQAEDEAGHDFAAMAGDRGGAQPDGWYDVEQGHAAREAWEMGYTGEGVTVAVLDNAIDFAHQDLHDTWKVLPEGHPYAGWPQMFDPNTGYQAVFDQARAEEVRSSRIALTGMIELYQTSAVEERDVGGEMKPTACFQALQDVTIIGERMLADEACDFVVPESASGEVRFGHHPDTVLRALGAKEGILGEYAGVLLVDANTAGEYDTVYVDLNGDRDFTDEKPTSQASPLAWRDMTDDGIADLSGGLLYFISDGELPFPSMYLWGLEDQIPEAGRVVGFQFAGGGHGTLCASNVVSQGRLTVPDDLILEFRDLPGGGQPASTNLGLAPDAGMVSIGDVYIGGRILFEAGWRYAVLGHDPERDDDQIQTTSNSYGFSDIDNDGWEDSARLIDYYVNEFSPETSFLLSTGNGAPGYGTLAPPSPSVGLGIAASTQMGSTGTDSITDTHQITFGDIIPFSNRGPGSDGRTGATIAADGAYAAGASPINSFFLGGSNGAYANGTWGGTSRSGPVANGAMALVYDAFHEANDRWPTWEEAKSLIMSGARFAGYDTFVMGGGVLDAADAARIAGGKHGVYAMPPEWTAGGYRGESHAAFAKIMHPGDSATQTFALQNTADEDLDVTLSGQTLRRIGHYEQQLTTNRVEESAPSAVMDYLIPIDKEQIPDGTELMVVRGIFPMDEFDLRDPPLTAYSPDNSFSMGVMQHTDINGDGDLWEDGNGNGVVNHRGVLDSYVELNWDTEQLEIDTLEGGFTPPLPDEGIVAEIAWFGRGCDIDEPIQDVNEKIALIERGECRFDEKIPNAEEAGAIAVVLFTDDRAKVAMGGDLPVGISGVMMDRQPGLDLVGVLTQDAAPVVTAGIYKRTFRGKGLGGAPPITYKDTEIDEYEYMRVTQDGSSRNNWAASVHHPLERWADGLHIALWHVGRTTAVTNTHVQFRLDFYKYEDWDALTLAESTVTIPAGDVLEVEATLALGQDAILGAHQGAIFVDYDRGEGDEPVDAPGGYELPHQRAVVPVNVNVAPSYEWEGALTFGGDAGNDMDAPYNNGAVRGAFNWSWRNESGDWRFFFLDASEPPADTYWLTRTTWEDDNLGQADVDTRFYGPVVDQFSNPDDARNDPTDYSDPDWYGPYTLGLVTQSAYSYLGGGIFTYSTSSGEHEDWLAAPAGEGLHEVMLDNVLFSGTQFDMPVETTVSSLQMGGGATLFGDACGQLEFTSHMELPGFQIRGFGMSVPEVFDDAPTQQDDPDDRTTSSFKHDVMLDDEAGRFVVTLNGEDDDDLDLVLLYDMDGDGEFAYPTERLVEGTSEDANEQVALSGFPPAGHYQIWVHGWQVMGDDSAFDLEIDVVSGDTIQVNDVPDEVKAGQPVSLEVCADMEALEGEDGPAYGIVVFGPGGAPTIMQVSVTWWRTAPTIFLPAVTQNWDYRGEAEMPMP